MQRAIVLCLLTHLVVMHFPWRHLNSEHCKYINNEKCNLKYNVTNILIYKQLNPVIELSIV